MTAKPYYKQVIPAEGWAFVQSPAQGSREAIVFAVSAWAFTENREVIGLISVPDSPLPSKTTGVVCSALEPPKHPGLYKPILELSDAERASLETGNR